MSRNLLVCLDGTRNEPETGASNVVRLYELAAKDDAQLAYYDPGVGTMGARSAITAAGRALTRTSGLVLGYGIRENIEEAYHWLMDTYEPGDRLLIVGFSRGSYTALALAGMLRAVGLLRPGADNLIPYALKLYARGGKKPGEAVAGNPKAKAAEKKFFGDCDDFNANFGNPSFPSRFDHQVAFLGLWDTVKSVGWLNARAMLEQARWPFTRNAPNVAAGRLALALDETRRPYSEYRFDQQEVTEHPGRLAEMWFAGVHSDVGGQFPDDHGLSDIALGWMVGEAANAGLRVDERTYRKLLGVAVGEPLPACRALGKIHANSPWWVLAGGWHHRPVRPRDQLHPSVAYRIEATADTPHPYRPDLRTRL